MPYALEIDHFRGYPLLRVIGDLDQDIHRELADELLAMAGTAPRAIMDVSAVSFIDLASVAMLTGVSARLRAREGALVLVCTTPRVRRVLQLAGLDTQVPLVDTLADAADYLDALPGP